MIEQLRYYLEAAWSTPVVPSCVVIVTSFVLGRLLSRVLRMVIVRTSRRTRNTWDDQLANMLAGPLSTVIVLIALTATLPWLPLPPVGRHLLGEIASAATVVAVVWGTFRCIDLARGAVERQAWARERPASRSLLRLGARFAKGTAVSFGLLIGLAQLGVSVGSLIAGLGIGGLVLALAAQKTVENLFGTVSIGVDQPMREGDFVKIGDTVGTVEQIGLRSTRVRTLDRTIVTIPNGDLSNQRVESFAARDRIRLACTIGLVYDTTPRQIRDVLAAFERILLAHPKIVSDAVIVRFVKLGEWSLDIDVMTWFLTSDWNEFQTIRQEILIAFMEAVADAGTQIAFPTQTLQVTRPATMPATRGRKEARA
jgi:MscS family membrane protein